MNKSKKIISFAILSFLAIFQLNFILNAGIVTAGPLWDSQTGMNTDDGNIGAAFGDHEPDDIRVVIARYIEVFLELLGIVFLILILVSGFRYMMSQGDSKKTESALSGIKTAVIGLAIILMAFGITIFVEKSLVSATNG